MLNFVCRCGCISYTQSARIKHLKSKLHANFQKNIEREIINNLETTIINNIPNISYLETI